MINPTASRPALPRRAVVAALTATVIIIGFVELKLLEARELAENPPQRIDTLYCLKCHTEPNVLNKIREKEGRSGIVFSSDGTFREKGHDDLYREMEEYKHKTKLGRKATADLARAASAKPAL